jgi:hypothetical protein
MFNQPDFFFSFFSSCVCYPFQELQGGEDDGGFESRLDGDEIHVLNDPNRRVRLQYMGWKMNVEWFLDQSEFFQFFMTKWENRGTFIRRRKKKKKSEERGGGNM